VMSGLKGVVVSSRTRTLELKKKMTAMIIEKLRALTGATITRMEYDRFDEQVTRKYGVVVKNWPFKTFRNPSAITSRIDLDVLYRSWNSGATYFEKLSKEDMKAWEIEQSRMTSIDEPDQDHPGPTSVVSPDSLQEVPPAPIANLTSESTLSTTLQPPVPDPNMIAMMIQADPTLQNVDPTLIAMGVTQPRVASMPSRTPLAEQPPNHVPHVSSAKRRWQEIVTPVSYDTYAAKKPKKQRTKKDAQNAPAV